MIYYTPSIITKAGFFPDTKQGTHYVLIATILIFSLNSIGIFIACFLVDKVGRRGLLLIF